MKKENKRRIKRRLRKSKHLLLFSSNIICFHLLRLRANLSIPQLIFENQFYHPRAESPIKLYKLRLQELINLLLVQFLANHERKSVKEKHIKAHLGDNKIWLMGSLICRISVCGLEFVM